MLHTVGVVGTMNGLLKDFIGGEGHLYAGDSWMCGSPLAVQKPFGLRSGQGYKPAGPSSKKRQIPDE